MWKIPDFYVRSFKWSISCNEIWCEKEGWLLTLFCMWISFIKKYWMVQKDGCPLLYTSQGTHCNTDFWGPRHSGSLSLGRSPSTPISHRLHGAVDIGGFGGFMSLYNNMKITDYFLCIHFHLLLRQSSYIIWRLLSLTSVYYNLYSYRMILRQIIDSFWSSVSSHKRRLPVLSVVCWSCLWSVH